MRTEEEKANVLGNLAALHWSLLLQYSSSLLYKKNLMVHIVMVIWRTHSLSIPPSSSFFIIVVIALCGSAGLLVHII